MQRMPFYFVMTRYISLLLFVIIITTYYSKSADSSSQAGNPIASSTTAQPLSGGSPGVDAELNPITVIGQLDQAREQIVPYLGATKYQIGPEQLQTQSQGDNAPFNQVILRAPGVAQDSFGQLHVRDEHANLQFRINDVLIPEGISGFGQELDTRLIDNVSLITGSLPAQFGFRTAGIIDVHTKSGASLNGGAVSFYGGSYNTYNPSFEAGGTQGKFSYFVTGSYKQDDLGIENPTSAHGAIHDETKQWKGFANLSYVIDESSRITLLLSGTYSDFQIPNNPGQTPAFTLKNVAEFDSRNLNENQHEQNDYAILAYQKSFDNVNLQIAAFSRYSSTYFTPDWKGDLIFNGVASQVDREIFSNGVQVDVSWAISDSHVLRGGLLFTGEAATVNTTNLAFPVDANGLQSSNSPSRIIDNNSKSGMYYGFYLQDEWHVFEPLTINFGARFDVVDEFTHSSQLSPRINIVYQPTKSTTLHIGYARYFTPPPLELVPSESIKKFAGTTNQPAVTQSSTVKAERAHYFDAGITRQIGSSFSVGVDAYYKISRDLIDEGQFGTALIFAPFNYAKANQYGVEVTANYSQGGFNAYANFGFERGTGEKIVSGQFQFSPADLAYIQNHYVFLDHDQRFTVSAGVSYTYKDTTISSDLLFGSGLRHGFANTDELDPYYTVNLGIAHQFRLSEGHGQFKVRFDIVNLFDQSYAIRDGSGIGVGAPQFGARRGLYGGISWNF
jgi:outer membrane receptor protein involved in Fe transport